MKPLHINVTRSAMAASLASCAAALYALASPLHTIIGLEPGKVEAYSTVLGTLAAMVAGFGHSVVTPQPPSPPDQPTAATPFFVPSTDLTTPLSPITHPIQGEAT